MKISEFKKLVDASSFEEASKYLVDKEWEEEHKLPSWLNELLVLILVLSFSNTIFNATKEIFDTLILFKK